MAILHITFDPPRKEIYPTYEDALQSDDYCPNCRNPTFTITCSECGGEGGHDGYEEDPLWYDEGEIIPCDWCRGEGYHHWCPRCGWDLNRPARQNTPEWRGKAIAPLSHSPTFPLSK